MLKDRLKKLTELLLSNDKKIKKEIEESMSEISMENIVYHKYSSTNKVLTYKENIFPEDIIVYKKDIQVIINDEITKTYENIGRKNIENILLDLNLHEAKTIKVIGEDYYFIRPVNYKLSSIDQDIKCLNDNFGNVEAAIDSLTQNVDDNSGDLIVLQKEVTEVKKSVSDGKDLVATAITEKGVATENTDTFPVIAENISKIPTGSKNTGIAKYKLAADKGVITDKVGIAVIEEDTDGQNT